MNPSTQYRSRRNCMPKFRTSARHAARGFLWPAPAYPRILLMILLGVSSIARAQPAHAQTNQGATRDGSAARQQRPDAGQANAAKTEAATSTTGTKATRNDTPEASAPAPSTPSNDEQSAEDAALRAEIEARLSRALIGKDGFQFTVRSGVVTWTGETSIPQHKGAATRMARSSGAKQVVNRIMVKGSTQRPPRQDREPTTHIRKAVVRWRATQRH